MPFTQESASSAGKKGGSARTFAQKKALRDLHRARKGRRVRVQCIGREDVMAAALQWTTEHRGSTERLAAWCQVSERTLRRWLRGQMWATPDQVTLVNRWLHAEVQSAMGDGIVRELKKFVALS